MNSFYTQEELEKMPFKQIGRGNKISRFCHFYNIEKICIGENVRIDDFTILSGEIILGNNIHISAYCGLYGGAGIELQDYSGISPKSLIYSIVDDFSGDYLIGPVHNKDFVKFTKGKVLIEKYCQILSNTVVLPNIKIGEGSVIGALSLVNRSIDEWGIYAGIPAKYIKDRRKGLLRFVK